MICEKSKAQFSYPQFTKIDKSKGISTSIVVGICTDKNYRYWLASFNGLIEYDGNKFKTYHMPFYQNGLLGSDFLYQIEFENDSILWITHRSGVARFNINSKSFELIPVKNIPSTSSVYFNYLFIDREKKVFFVTRGIEVYEYDPVKNIVDIHKPLSSESNGRIFKISDISQKYYMLHTRTKGLLLFDKINGVVIDKKLVPQSLQWINNKEFKGLVTDYRAIGKYKFISVRSDTASFHHVFKVDTIDKTMTRLSEKFTTGRFFYKDSFGRLWIYGFGGQVKIFDLKTDSIYNISAKEEDFTICYKIFEDHENNIWLATNNGLLTYNIHQNNYEELTKNNPAQVFSEVMQVSPNTIWFGSIDKGLYEYNTDTRLFKNYNFSEKNVDVGFNKVFQIYKQKKDSLIWLLCSAGRFIKYNVLTKEFEFYKDSLFGSENISISESPEGKVFIASQKGRILTYDKFNKKFNYLFDLNNVKQTIKNIEIVDIVALANNELLIGTSGNGLIRLDLSKKTMKIFEINPSDTNSLRSNIINILRKFDDSGIVFAGTSNGIFSYDSKNNRVKNYSFDNDLGLGTIFEITRDIKGNIIFLGVNSLFMLNWESGNIIDLGQKSNLDGLNINDIYYSLNLKKLFIVTDKSVYQLTLSSADHIPEFRPIIYSLESFDKIFPITNQESITLERPYNSFRINFGSSSYKFKDDLEYYYQLNDNGWVAAKSREVAFIQLPGGQHNFKLKVIYKGNRNIQKISQLTINIKKAFYEQIWFYIFLTADVLGIFYLFYRMRLKRLLAIEKIRFQLSRDLHDDMGSTLSTINILSTIADKSLLNDPELSKNYLKRISSNCKDMMESMDDIIWSINPANDLMENIVFRMREFAVDILKPKNILFVINISDEVQAVNLKMIVRRDFFLIFKEAVNNAAKYSDCTSFEVEVLKKNKYLIMNMKDNGKGFMIDESSQGNGLTNMKKRALVLKGTLEIESKLNVGTNIRLQIPIN